MEHDIKAPPEHTSTIAPEALPINDSMRLSAIKEGRLTGLPSAVSGYVATRSSNQAREAQAIQRRYNAPQTGAQTSTTEGAVGVQI